ncbi:MAG: flagellar biosynthesis protein FlhA [Planctomycetota bacterium]|nr:MAG: flagellar biosynthesis protein FlhA [Planctomycetota bacterium]
MNRLLDRILAFLSEHRSLALPAALLGMVVVLVAPLSPLVMDVLVVLNFALAALVLVRAATLRSPLDFSVFPALLLGTTLFRLVINVASTRLILGANAVTPAEAQGVAGQFIEAFGKLVAGNNIAVGAVVFLILVIVQFVVITKGASRMAEVAARFALDALPGRQMAIDADLAAGAIDGTEARERRDDLAREADFFGAMDGASRFVRGDAIAGLVITGVNIVGGIATGVFQKGWTLAETGRAFTVLTIGDGLAAQIPAFVIAIAAGLVVARAGRGRTLGEEMPKQLVGNPRSLWMLAGFMAVLSFTPLPTMPLLLGAAVIGLGALIATRVERTAARGASTAMPVEQAASRGELTRRATSLAVVDPAIARRTAEIGALLAVEPLEVEIGASLVELARAGDASPILRRIEAVRRQVAQDLGIVVPAVRVRDDRSLAAGGYRIRVRGATVGEGELRLGELLAMPGDGRLPRLPGIRTREPAFGLDALWIAPSLRPQAEAQGCAVASPESVLGAHFATVVRRHADELLTREHVADLLTELAQRAPRLVAEAVPSCIRPGELQRVMQLLLRERVPVRDLEAVLESIADAAQRSREPHSLAEAARLALRRTICQQYARPDDEGRPVLTVVVASQSLDALVASAITLIDGEPATLLTPADAAAVVRAVAAAAKPLAASALPVVVISTRTSRSALARLLTPHIPGCAVLAYDELVRGIEVDRIGEAVLTEQGTEVAA